MKEAMLYEKLEGKRVRCNLCRHRCRISDGERGICHVRENRGGILYTLVYDKVVSTAVDPIEKKPFFHFQPGSKSFSIATMGCNFRCTFCQNASISQAPRDEGVILGEEIPPEEIVKNALRYGSRSISYTYTEPTIFFELAYDTARVARDEGLKNNFVTNGYMTPEAIETIHPYLDAANVDLKSFSDDFYHRYVGARLEGVLDSLKLLKKRGIWVEVTTLIIPGLNDSDEELENIARFILKELGEDVPWHVSRFYPAYRMLDRTPTPVETVKRAREIGKKAGLRYVYIGNVPGEEGENTYCHNCGNLLIRRVGFSSSIKGLKDGKCARCGTPMTGVDL